MSEWIDFLVYATQAVLLCIAVPRWFVRFTRPALMDRNPEWVAANPAAVARLENGGWWMKSIQAWGVISVVALLVHRLYFHSSWEVLMTTDNFLVIVGVLILSYGLLTGYRWIKRIVPLAECRQATLTPRSINDFVPRWFQILVWALTVSSILARPVLEAYFPGHLKHVWGPSGVLLFISALAFLATVGGVARAPNQFDRLLGPAYRRMEVSLGFILLACIAILALVTLWLEFNGADTRRYGSLILSLCVSAVFAGFIRLPRLPRDDMNGGATIRRTGSA